MLVFSYNFALEQNLINLPDLTEQLEGGSFNSAYLYVNSVVLSWMKEHIQYLKYCSVIIVSVE